MNNQSPPLLLSIFSLPDLHYFPPSPRECNVAPGGVRPGYTQDLLLNIEWSGARGSAVKLPWGRCFPHTPVPHEKASYCSNFARLHSADLPVVVLLHVALLALSRWLAAKLAPTPFVADTIMANDNQLDTMSAIVSVDGAQ